MKLRQLFENIYEEQGVEDVAIIFGRFNPPHKGHVAAWKAASKFAGWYVGTNQDTQGPKDPLPFNIKMEAMKTLWDEVESHLVAEQSWWTLASYVYKQHGPVTLHVVTDEKDAKIFVPGLQKSNGVEGPHGFYRFKDIVWERAPRVSSATDLRKAVEDNDPQKFEQAAGVPADTNIAGAPYFQLVRKYMLPYLIQAAEKEKAKADRERAKAEKEKAKAEKINKPQVSQDIEALEQELQEARVSQGHLSKRQQQATRGVHTFADAERWNADYVQYRTMIAAGMTDGTNSPDMDAKSWVGKSKVAFPYTDEEVAKLKKAYKAAGASYQDLNKGDTKSQELETTNTVSPVAKPKKNKYGV